MSNGNEWPTYEVNEPVGSVFPGEFGVVKAVPTEDDYLAPNNYRVDYGPRRGVCLVHAKHMTKLTYAVDDRVISANGDLVGTVKFDLGDCDYVVDFDGIGECRVRAGAIRPFGTGLS